MQTRCLFIKLLPVREENNIVKGLEIWLGIHYSMLPGALLGSLSNNLVPIVD